MKTKILVILILAGLLFTGCAKQQTNPDNNQQTKQPQQIGNDTGGVTQEELDALKEELENFQIEDLDAFS